MVPYFQLTIGKKKEGAKTVTIFRKRRERNFMSSGIERQRKKRRGNLISSFRKREKKRKILRFRNEEGKKRNCREGGEEKKGRRIIPLFIPRRRGKGRKRVAALPSFCEKKRTAKETIQGEGERIQKEKRRRKKAAERRDLCRRRKENVKKEGRKNTQLRIE